VATLSYDGAGRLSGVDYPTGWGYAGNGTKLTGIGYDSIGRQNTLEWRTSGGTLITSDATTRNLAGQITDQTIDGTDAYPAGANFGYDAAGRLTSARATGLNLAYNFAPSGGCGASTTAGKNTNRTSMVSNGSTTTYCYDAADRLTSTKTRRRFHGRIGAAATHSTRPTDTPQRDVTSTNPQSSRSTALESRRGELG